MNRLLQKTLLVWNWKMSSVTENRFNLQGLVGEKEASTTSMLALRRFSLV
jgi:hypothetical protein